MIIEEEAGKFTGHVSKTGLGRFEFKETKDRYEGEFNEDGINGKGVMYFANGSTY